jgi:uncharacterized protein
VYDSPVKTPLQVVRKAAFAAIPWKNGGGITLEALRVPETSAPFRWRVSVAQIDASGPFSDFAGYNRKMVLLRGGGVALKFGTGETRELRKVGDWVEFDGAGETYCELLNGACVDLNLMVSQSMTAEARVASLNAEIEVRAGAQQATLVFAVEGPLLLESDSGKTVRLEPWDLAVLRDEGARLKPDGNRDLSTAGCVFIATLNN